MAARSTLKPSEKEGITETGLYLMTVADFFYIFYFYVYILVKMYYNEFE